MPYHRCPACGLTGYGTAAWSSPRTCENCSAALTEDSQLALVPGAGHDVDRELLARPEAAAQARHTVAALDLPQATRDSLTMIVTELVTNAVRHAGVSEDDAVDLHLSTGPGPVRLSVRDRGGGFDPAALDARPDPLQVGGQGLVIVGALAQSWGVQRDADGCTVWCEVGVERHAPRETPQETLCEPTPASYAGSYTPTLSAGTAS
jgi:anti-sigma regulatory factor (Ser/Thr protein kinase)